MKNHLFVWLFVSLFLLAVPAAQTFASDDEVEITLLEVSGFLPGDDPLSTPDQEGDVPPQPNEFRATISGMTLEITSGTHSAQLIVRDELGVQVLSSQFVGGTIELMPAPGSYSLEIQSASLTLVGAFVVQ